MSDWIRPLFRATGASREWHAPRIKGVTTATYCGRSLEGPLEIAREDRAEREGRCATCATRLKKPAAKKSVNKPAPKKKSSRAPVAKRSVRRSGRGRA